MKDNSLPTADYNEFKDYDNASKYLATKKMPIVVKYDGLAAGKGVDICDSPRSKFIYQKFIKA